MSADAWAPRRFWTRAEVREAEGGHAVTLDGRPVRTPAKAPLVLPSRALAEAIAAEWDAQEDRVDPASMPFTRLSNTSLDRVGPQHGAVVAMIAEYGGADLTCYRAVTPATLARRQAEAWDPLLDWADATFGARLTPVAGVMHLAQPTEALARLTDAVSGQDPFRLTALADLVSISGSLVLGLAVAHRHLDAGAAWPLSRVDEDWQSEQWGRDDEAEAHAALKRADFLRAERMLALLDD
ncbi:ATPase [Paroceanicella profunda]|uniref:ATPase n=1 Tax=Paroceanicella profunda TaxID=2579971 RepID=A0A5B8FPW2_9RHOB|nr:ATP12 family protein [Paroceanicella profunda]QDL90586.1 ATPase [Paroceanicella profunda]